MSRRNIFLSFSEWELISSELSDHEYHGFELHPRQLKEWKERIQNYHENGYTHGEPHFCFKRVGIYPIIEHVKSAKTYNILCRENWREQDIYYVMRCSDSFIGFILNYVNDVDINTSFDTWESIRNQMLDEINKHEQRYWSWNKLISMYEEIIQQTSNIP